MNRYENQKYAPGQFCYPGATQERRRGISFPKCRYFPGDIPFYCLKIPDRKDARASEKPFHGLGAEKKPPANAVLLGP